MAGVCGGGDMHGQGACMVGGAWPEACVAGEMATATGGTHPTGMHSCYVTIHSPPSVAKYDRFIFQLPPIMERKW